MSDATHEKSSESAWPDLTLPRAAATAKTIQLWSQIVGKTRLALAPLTNHWWNVTLYVNARGLTTTAMPLAEDGHRELEVEFDLIAHELLLRTSDGGVDSFALGPGTLEQFYHRYMAGLERLGIQLKLFPRAVEIPDPVYLDRDHIYRDYDPEWAHRFFVALGQAHRLLSEFRAGFLGKASPVHFFWGGFDLAVTRFSGRPAPRHPGGIPNTPDYVSVEAYSHEVSSAGFWPGDDRLPEPVFYSYAYPEPAGFANARVQPCFARYEQSLGLFVLPYARVREARDPDRDVRGFLESTYIAAADLARWDRLALERPPPSRPADHRGRAESARL